MSMYVVEVNEVLLFTYSTKEVAHRWAMFHQCNPPERFDDLVHSLAGNRVNVMCDDEDEAKWLVRHIISWGAPSKAVKVKHVVPAAEGAEVDRG